jgi:hypothetical protein
LLSVGIVVTVDHMKAVTVREAQSQLSQLIAEACRGEFIIVTDGDRQVALEPRISLDLEKDSPELEAVLLKAVDGPHAPFSEDELRTLARQAQTEFRARHPK